MPIDDWSVLMDPLYASIKLYLYSWVLVIFGYMIYPTYLLAGIYGLAAPEQAEWLFLESTTADQYQSSWNVVQNYLMREWQNYVGLLKDIIENYKFYYEFLGWSNRTGVLAVAKNFMVMAFWFPLFFTTAIIYMVFGALCLPYLYLMWLISLLVDWMQSKKKQRY